MLRVMDTERLVLESFVVADGQALSAESDQIGRVFAGTHDLSANDFRALVHIMVAENAGTVSKVAVKVGDVIQAGDLIAVIS